MSSEESRKISGQEIQRVQNLVEQCLQRYMTQKEAMNILSVKEKIEPGFTELVWQKLEQENQEFFKAYHLRLMLKDQIMEFNRLLGRQVELMQHVDTAGASFLPINGSHIQPMHQNSACYAPDNIGPTLKTENMHQQHITATTNIPNEFTNCGLTSMPSCMQTPVNISPNMLLTNHNSNVGMSGGMIKTESGYPGISQFIYGADGNLMETSFSSVASNSQPLNETLMDADNSSYGLLGQIPQSFGLSDLTAEFSHDSDVLENYSTSHFIGTDSNDFLDSHGRVGENQGDQEIRGGWTPYQKA